LPIVPAALTTALSVLALLLALAAIALATLANRRWAARPRPRPSAPDGDGDGPVGDGDAPTVASAAAVLGPDEAAALLADLAELRGQVTVLRTHLERAAEEARVERPDPTALRHVALVRYDAFADVGGRLSYSVALLDDTRSGLVLTTLAGKSDVRTYVRTISGGSADGTLTAEEQQAIEAAGGHA
jgi:Protein of unknown function (DUF4446)